MSWIRLSILKKIYKELQNKSLDPFPLPTESSAQIIWHSHIKNRIYFSNLKAYINIPLTNVGKFRCYCEDMKSTNFLLMDTGKRGGVGE